MVEVLVVEVVLVEVVVEVVDVLAPPLPCS